MHLIKVSQRPMQPVLVLFLFASAFASVPQEDHGKAQMAIVRG